MGNSLRVSYAEPPLKNTVSKFDLTHGVWSTSVGHDNLELHVSSESHVPNSILHMYQCNINLL